MSTLLIMAGGTGGHVFPAMAVARRLRERGVNIVWLGTRRGLEARIVPQAGIEMEWISIRGLLGKGVLGWLLLPARLLLAMLQMVIVLFRRRPDALLGMGGFVSGPGGLVAWLLRRPLLIHEANARAGMTNRWLARLADRVLTGFPDTEGIHQSRATYVGNPVRSEIAVIPEPAQRYSGRRDALRLLVLGGSQGARIFNEAVPQAIRAMGSENRPQVWHQCGRGSLGPTRQAYADMADVEVSEFIEDMSAAYAWADLVLCRAGAMTVAELAAVGVAAILVPFPYAMTVAELAAVGVAAILVPFPYAAEDHQTANARYLAEHGAALLLPQQDFSTERLQGLLTELAGDRSGLLRMATAARNLARSDATNTVADVCMEVMRA
jgi:UDP-N-acetylglucosamine--N-acetylmuramyl-(pentapeptide) pyrophosphoryl-undecaprenol N-acetylglucosamine transferase